MVGAISGRDKVDVPALRERTLGYFGISCTWCRCTASCAWSTTSAASASSKPVEGEVYFHRNSVIEVEFDAIEPGSKVRLEVAEREGDDGWQATTVRLIGKYHVQDLTA